MFRKGDLNINAESFIPQSNPELTSVNVEPDEVVEIIKENCRSTDKNVNVAKKTDEAMTSRPSTSTNVFQQALSQTTVDNYNEINAKCEGNLRNVSEVKPPRKRSNFKDRDNRKKFQGISKNEMERRN
jgi:hypothetical protein